MGRRTIVLVVALLLAAISAFAIWNFLSSAEDEAQEGQVRVPVYRAIELVPRGVDGADVLDKFELGSELEEFMPQNAITTEADLQAILLRSVSVGPISEGQIVTTDLWGDPADQVAGLSELITPGFQAISIRPDEVRGVGGFVRPGDRVNVIATGEVDLTTIVNALRSPAGRAVFFPGLQGQLGFDDEQMAQLADALPVRSTVTQFVLQDLLVVAVGEITGPEAEAFDPDAEPPGALEPLGSQVITLEVTAEQAEELVFVQETLTSWLTLVPADFEPAVTPGVEIDDVLDLPDEFIEELRSFGFSGAPGS